MEHAGVAAAAAAHHRAEVGHQIEALADQEATYDLASAVHGKERSLLLQLVSYLVVSLALSFQVDLNNSNMQLAIIMLVVVGYMLSDIITSMLVTLLQLDSFSRPQLAVFVQFCVTTPLSFIGYVAVNVVRDNVIASDTSPQLETIIPICAFLCLAYIELLYSDTQHQQFAAAHDDLRKQLVARADAGANV